MKKTLIGITMVAVLYPMVAQSEFSANVALTSDYVWRGVSQTLNDPAIQGSIDYAHDDGFYAGVWASNVEFVDDTETDVEIDYYGGYSREYDSSFNWDVSINAYTYPGSSIDTVYEFFFSAGYHVFTATMARDFDNKNNYYQLAAEADSGNDFTLAAHIGKYDFNNDTDYSDYRLALSKEIKGFGFELAYTDTNMSDSECANFSGALDLCDGQIIFTISREM